MEKLFVLVELHEIRCSEGLCPAMLLNEIIPAIGKLHVVGIYSMFAYMVKKQR